jgi:molecular chaperone IbpA
MNTSYTLSLTDPYLFSWERQINTLNSVKQALPKSIPTYPPTNIAKIGVEKWVIEMALAGFKKEDLTITVKEGLLSVESDIPESIPNENERDYIHRGIAYRSFKREFSLADDVKVIDATLEDGLLRVYLEREIPEEKKPKILEIRTPEVIKQINK